MTLCTVLSGLTGLAQAAALSVTVLKADGKPLPEAVIIVEGSGYPAARNVLKATMDQRELMFVPEVLVVRTGTAVEFPNSDQVRHQVYSFSGAKNFQLPLYAGRTQPPVLFDKPGLVTLGCNIHDNMIAHIIVSDSPWHGRSNEQGVFMQRDLPAGRYTLKIWHARMNEGRQFIEQQLTVGEGDAGASVQLNKNLRPAMHHHAQNKQWQDY